MNTYLGDISASYKILDNLEYKFLYSINQSDGNRATNVDGFMPGLSPVSGAGLGINSYASLTSQVFQHTLDYKTTFGQDLNFEALAGFEYWKSNFSNSNYSALGFNTNLTQNTLGSIPYTSILQDGKTQNLPGRIC